MKNESICVHYFESPSNLIQLASYIFTTSISYGSTNVPKPVIS